MNFFTCSESLRYCFKFKNYENLEYHLLPSVVHRDVSDRILRFPDQHVDWVTRLMGRLNFAARLQLRAHSDRRLDVHAADAPGERS